ncbi:hypothetical protein [Nocardia brasiliensis]|uniref:hypothetical protein n=1 Tax=Nocardia brasiliensis TaxID=37326 RepID=UPI000A55F4C5|nr:hypothetical protein [Nocardia brasiliensis]
MTIHLIDDNDGYDREELDAVICLHTARQLIDDHFVPAWDEQTDQTWEWAA